MTQLRRLEEAKGLWKIEDLKAKLKSTTDQESRNAGIQLAKDAHSFGLSVRDFLKLSLGREDNDAAGLNGYERALCELGLPIRNDFDNGVVLQAASETFQTYPGTRAMFPEVIDDVLRWANRQDNVEVVAPMLASSRTINGVEVVSTVVDDDSADRDSFSVSELGRIPVRTIRTSEKTIKIWKHGSAIRTSYEFNRRVSLDIMVPYANRIARELELSKVATATGVLINGDGVNAAASAINQSSYNTITGVTATNGKINWPHFLRWLVVRAQNKTPIDTILMNWDGMFQWMLMFGEQTLSPATKNFGQTAVEALNKVGVNVQQMPSALSLIMNITPVLSSSVPAGQLIGFSRGDTLEELIEAGSTIQETERAILNQSITMVRTENTGYRLVYGDTRSIFVFDE